MSSPPSSSPEKLPSVVSNACTDLTLVLIGRPRYQGGPGLRVGSPEVGARLVGLNNPGRRRRTLRVCEWSWARLGVSQRSVGPRQMLCGDQRRQELSLVAFSGACSGGKSDVSFNTGVPVSLAGGPPLAISWQPLLKGAHSGEGEQRTSTVLFDSNLKMPSACPAVSWYVDRCGWRAMGSFLPCARQLPRRALCGPGDGDSCVVGLGVFYSPRPER